VNGLAPLNDGGMDRIRSDLKRLPAGATLTTELLLAGGSRRG